MKKKRVKKTFAQKVREGEKTVLYEFLPPPKALSKAHIDKSIALFSTMLNKFPVDGINLPEVLGETRNGARDSNLVKMEPRNICPFLRNYGRWELIINRPVVYLPWKKQKDWFLETYQDYNIRNFVLVGGESSKIIYPGISVNEAAKYIKNEFSDIFLGGIIIPTRKNEANRILYKTASGIEFFTTQILYEARSIKKVLKELWELYIKENIKPAMIFLSFTPIATQRDLKLLEWLGVDIAKKTVKELTTGWIGMGWHSIQVCKEILIDILSFVQKNGIDIPLGLNIEHVSIHNLELSFILVEELSQIYLNNRLNKGLKI